MSRTLQPLGSTPKFSVITVSYNHAEFIRDTIESVLAQNYPNFEHIVVDGGSTDNTVEILKQYPHLKWTSEKDRGQSDALNKGFSRATGDVIAWINSDDYYAQGTFAKVAEKLRNNAIVLGVTEEVDRHGGFRQRIENHPRSFEDLLMYWIPYAWLAQPGVFFRRDALESVRLSDGSYVDEGYDVSMDYELWLRLAREYPFREHIDSTVAYFRVYGENKTGANRPTGQRELGRAFRRHSMIASGAERRLGFILPVSDPDQIFAAPLDSIAKQSFNDFDVMFVDWSTDRETARMIRETVSKVEDLCKVIGVRYLRSNARHPYQAFNDGLMAARTNLVAFLQPGDRVPEEFVAVASNIFATDVTGLALPLANDPALRDAIYNDSTNGLRFEALYKHYVPYPNFVARTIALREVGGFHNWEHEPLAIRRMMMHVACRGWHVSASNGLAMTPYRQEVARLRDRIESSQGFLNAQMHFDSEQFMKGDPLRTHKVRQAIAPGATPELVARAERILQFAPPAWHRIGPGMSYEELSAIVERYPHFAPAWYYLARHPQVASNQGLHAMALDNFQQINQAFGG